VVLIDADRKIMIKAKNIDTKNAIKNTGPCVRLFC